MSRSVGVCDLCGVRMVWLGDSVACPCCDDLRRDQVVPGIPNWKVAAHADIAPDLARRASDPLLSIRKSRLEAALRNAVRVGENVAFPIDPSYPPNVDAYIARALTELEQA